MSSSLLQRKNAQTTLLLIRLVLVGFFEIHAVVIAETNSSSCMPYTLTAPQTLPLTLSILYLSSLTISYPISTQPSLLPSRPSLLSPSTLDHHFRSGVLFPTRSSPLVCTLEALVCRNVRAKMLQGAWSRRECGGPHELVTWRWRRMLLKVKIRNSHRGTSIR